MLTTSWSISRKFNTHTQQSVFPDKIVSHPHICDDLTVFTLHTFIRNKQAVPHICHDITWEASFAYNGLFESRERTKLSLHCIYASPFWKHKVIFSLFSAFSNNSRCCFPLAHMNCLTLKPVKWGLSVHVLKKGMQLMGPWVEPFRLLCV